MRVLVGGLVQGNMLLRMEWAKVGGRLRSSSSMSHPSMRVSLDLPRRRGPSHRPFPNSPAPAFPGPESSDRRCIRVSPSHQSPAAGPAPRTTVAMTFGGPPAEDRRPSSRSAGPSPSEDRGRWLSHPSMSASLDLPRRRAGLLTCRPREIAPESPVRRPIPASSPPKRRWSGPLRLHRPKRRSSGPLRLHRPQTPVVWPAPASPTPNAYRLAHSGLTVPNPRCSVPSEHQRPKSRILRPILLCPF